MTQIKTGRYAYHMLKFSPKFRARYAYKKAYDIITALFAAKIISLVRLKA